MLRREFTLEPHQQQAVQQTIDNKGRIFLAMPTGSGKTLTSIASVEALNQRGEAQNVLVLVPASLKENYIQAIKKFSDRVNIKEQTSGSSTRMISSGSPNDLTYTVMSYELFREQPDKYMMTTRGPIDSIVADEVSRYKTFDSKLAQAMIQVSPQVRNFITMSGSPSSNSPAEIVPIMQSVLNKKFEIKDPKDFEARYMKEVTVPGPDGRPMTERRLTNLKGLKELFGDSVFYLDKAKVSAKYPKEIDVVEKIPMGDKQYELYKYVMGTLDPLTKRKIERNEPMTKKEIKSVFSKIQAARALSISTQGVNPQENVQQTIKQSPKLKEMLTDTVKHLQTTPDGQVMIYSNMVEGGVRTISKALDALGIPNGVFAGQGKFPDRNRLKDLEAYKKGKLKVLVVSSAGREGLDLPNTTMVEIADPHYNPEVTSQAKARGIRINGQSNRPPDKRQVVVRKYLSTVPDSWLTKLHLKRKPRSIDEWIDSVSARKAKTNTEFVQVLNQLKTRGGPKIKPGEPVPEIAPKQVRSILSGKGLEFAYRRPRKDKGMQRGKYRERIARWKAQTPPPVNIQTQKD